VSTGESPQSVKTIPLEQLLAEIESQDEHEYVLGLVQDVKHGLDELRQLRADLEEPAKRASLEPLVRAYRTIAAAAATEWTALSWCLASDDALDGLSPVEWARTGRDPARLAAIARQDAARLAR
jgi:hypothetical protein